MSSQEQDDQEWLEHYESGEEMDKEEIDLICRACWDWMETVMPEYAEEIGLDLKKLDVAVKKFSQNNFLTGIPIFRKKERKDA